MGERRSGRRRDERGRGNEIREGLGTYISPTSRGPQPSGRKIAHGGMEEAKKERRRRETREVAMKV